MMGRINGVMLKPHLPKDGMEIDFEKKNVLNNHNCLKCTEKNHIMHRVTL